MLRWWSSTILLIRLIYLSLNYFVCTLRGLLSLFKSPPHHSVLRGERQKTFLKAETGWWSIPCKWNSIFSTQPVMDGLRTRLTLHEKQEWLEISCTTPNGKSQKKALLLLSSADLHQEENISSFSNLHLFCSAY